MTVGHEGTGHDPLPAAQHCVEFVGNVFVIESSRMRIVPERRRRVAVSEPSLRLEQFSFVNQMGGHPMSESVRCRIWNTGEPS